MWLNTRLPSGMVGGVGRLAPAAAFTLPADHPGFHDPEYRSRRAAISAVALRYRPEDPVPDVRYTPEEDDVWRIVSSELARKHERFACREFREASARLVLPTERVPQLREVDERLSELSGFRIRPVPGLVPSRVFYGALAEHTFLSTQYVRHHSAPFYTPEPDVIHEIIGHANMLASPVLADLHAAAGRASRRVTSDPAHEFFSRVFWFTLEFGVLHEDGDVRAWGAGLLSSYGEIDEFRSAEIRPWDLVAMGTQAYDITRYQPVLFAARSFGHAVDELGDFLESFDDEQHARLLHHAA
jgi:phenylalanine-4-hydroxylase